MGLTKIVECDACKRRFGGTKTKALHIVDGRCVNPADVSDLQKGKSGIWYKASKAKANDDEFFTAGKVEKAIMFEARRTDKFVANQPHMLTLEHLRRLASFEE